MLGDLVNHLPPLQAPHAKLRRKRRNSATSSTGSLASTASGSSKKSSSSSFSIISAFSAPRRTRTPTILEGAVMAAIPALVMLGPGAELTGLDAPWPHTFAAGDVAWARAANYRWRRVRIIEAGALERDENDEDGQAHMVYTASWTRDGAVFRQRFKPMAGELKPDTEAMRALLAGAYGRVVHGAAPLDWPPADEGTRSSPTALAFGIGCPAPQPAHPDQAWPYLFRAGQRAWARAGSGRWRRVHVVDDGFLEAGEQRERRAHFVYTAAWTCDGVCYRGVFSPLRGELKPDTDVVRELLDLEGVRFMHTDEPGCIIVACKACCVKGAEVQTGMQDLKEDADDGKSDD